MNRQITRILYCNGLLVLPHLSHCTTIDFHMITYAKTPYLIFLSVNPHILPGDSHPALLLACHSLLHHNSCDSETRELALHVLPFDHLFCHSCCVKGYPKLPYYLSIFSHKIPHDILFQDGATSTHINIPAVPIFHKRSPHIKTLFAFILLFVRTLFLLSNRPGDTP